MPYLNANQINVYYEIYGSGRPVIFVHPPLTGHVIFKYQKKLSDKMKIVFYDCRGHGRSGFKESGANVLLSHVEDLNQLIEKLDLKKPILVGYSHGGAIALSFALNYGYKVSGLILSGGFVKTNTLLLSQVYNAGIILSKFKQKRLLSEILALGNCVTKGDRKILYEYGKKAEIRAVEELYRSGKEFDITCDLHKLNKLPLLVVYGSKDKIVLPNKKYFSTLKNAEISYIKGGKHQLPMRWHHEFNNKIIHFLSKNDLL